VTTSCFPSMSSCVSCSKLHGSRCIRKCVTAGEQGLLAAEIRIVERHVAPGEAGEDFETGGSVRLRPVQCRAYVEIEQCSSKRSTSSSPTLLTPACMLGNSRWIANAGFKRAFRRAQPSDMQETSSMVILPWRSATKQCSGTKHRPPPKVLS